MGVFEVFLIGKWVFLIRKSGFLIGKWVFLIRQCFFQKVSIFVSIIFGEKIDFWQWQFDSGTWQWQPDSGTGSGCVALAVAVLTLAVPGSSTDNTHGSLTHDTHDTHGSLAVAVVDTWQ
jgi:hypothetical protein